MIRILTTSLALTLALPLAAQEASATALPSSDATAEEAGPQLIRDGRDVDLAEFMWIARPIVVFADSPNDPAYQRQIAFLTERAQDLIDRDVIVLTDTDPAAQSALRTRLRPRGFMLALIGKDGGVKLRKPLPWDVREISRVIDKMPMRQQEIDERRSGG